MKQNTHWKQESLAIISQHRSVLSLSLRDIGVGSDDVGGGEYRINAMMSMHIKSRLRFE